MEAHGYTKSWPHLKSRTFSSLFNQYRDGGIRLYMCPRSSYVRHVWTVFLPSQYFLGGTITFSTGIGYSSFLQCSNCNCPLPVWSGGALVFLPPLGAAMGARGSPLLPRPFWTLDMRQRHTLCAVHVTSYRHRTPTQMFPSVLSWGHGCFDTCRAFPSLGCWRHGPLVHALCGIGSGPADTAWYK